MNIVCRIQEEKFAEKFLNALNCVVLLTNQVMIADGRKCGAFPK
jgi:hypothetical protein